MIENPNSLGVIFLQFFLSLEAILLAVALSVDALLAAFAYGSQNIKIPTGSLVVLGLVCSGILGVTLHLGTQIGGFLGEGTAAGISFAILFGLGLFRIFDSWFKHWLRKRGSTGGQIKFSAFRLNFILQVYVDPEAADRDHSRTLSAGEAAALAIALSLDGIAAGLGAGLVGAAVGLTVGATFLFTIAAVALGCKLGVRVAGRMQTDISWISGGLLILLAVLQM